MFKSAEQVRRVQFAAEYNMYLKLMYPRTVQYYLYGYLHIIKVLHFVPEW